MRGHRQISDWVTNVTVLIFLGAAGQAWAVDGVVLIDQARAFAGNVTPGDAPGYPVTLSRSGSFRLSGNLTVPNENTTAIDVVAGGVTIDLNGFEIRGPVICPAPGNCSPIGTGRGINAAERVMNGRVIGMGSHGIVASRVEGVLVSENGGTGVTCDMCLQIRALRNYGTGIEATGSATNSNVVVKDSVTTGNGLDGIFAQGAVVNCTATGNGARQQETNGRGIRVVNGTVTGSVATNNFRTGISANASTVSESSAQFNGNTGIFGFSSTLKGNSVSGNPIGIRVTTGIIIGNTVFGGNQSEVGLELAGSVGYGNNLLFSNPGGHVTGSGGIQIGQNVCDNALCP